MKRHGYVKWKEVDQEIRKLADSSGVLGQLSDGTYECEIVEVRGVGAGAWEVTLRHGQHIHVSQIDRPTHRRLQEITGFRRPAGGQGIFKLINHKIKGVY